ncbi:MAG TPA: MFS transporter [Chitinophagaceae bacterium]|nr:MFS transporter [Chitinophagaceae bacterium]
MKIITRTVWILSIVSLFADVASEMLYPVIPVYLQQIGFSVLWIGVLEGLANFTAGLSKGYFGKLSDEKGVRLPFIKWGYFLSALSKPMMAIFIWPLWIFFARTIDRLGKGVRTAARDALLSKEATRETKARVFAFHRGWDTVGAMIGPIVALTLLSLYEGQYKTVFYIAFIPGLISVALIFLLKEKKQPESTIKKGNFFSFFSYWKIANRDYRKLVIGLLLLALFNSSDVFLLLRTKQITNSDFTTISVYIVYNFVYAISSYPMGVLADKFGIKNIYIAGLFLFVIVYTGFAFATETWMIYALFTVYGIFAAATEGIAKAWITNLAHEKNTATAIGFYTSCESICALLASIIAGAIWTGFGALPTFILTAAIAVIVIFYFMMMRSGVREA